MSNEMTKWSYSRVECFKKCPYQFKLRYINKLKTIPDQEADNALYLGTALHTGMEEDIPSAIKSYYGNYYVINDAHVNEAVKLETVLDKGKPHIPEGENEVPLNSDDYVGFIDRLVQIDENTYDLYDYKYSNNVDRYLESGQLSVYKYKFEQLNPGKRIRKLYFVFFPKTKIRQKKTETIAQFRARIKETLDKEPSVRVVEVPYSPEKVEEYESTIREIGRTKKFERNVNRLCDWCEYKDYCLNGQDWMILRGGKR